MNRANRHQDQQILGDALGVPDEALAALRAAAQRITANRRRMSLERAEDIVRTEFE